MDYLALKVVDGRLQRPGVLVLHVCREPLVPAVEDIDLFCPFLDFIVPPSDFDLMRGGGSSEGALRVGERAIRRVSMHIHLVLLNGVELVLDLVI